MIRMVWEGHYLDGKTAEKRPASIELSNDSLKIRVGGHELLVWPYREVRQVQGFYAGEPVKLERGSRTPEMLIIDDPDFLSSLRRISPEATRHFHDPALRPLRRRLVLSAAAGLVGMVFCLYFWGIPLLSALVVPHIPLEWETRLGQSTLEALAPEDALCRDPELGRAIEGITAILASREHEKYLFRVYVVRSPMVNAVALPGGNIIVFSGLLEKTGSPEELAGVIAHEIQHITKRHALKRIVEDFSTGLMISAVTGDATGAMVYSAKIAHMMAQLSYSRQDEEEADREGMRIIMSSGIDPGGMIRLFQTIGDGNEIPGVLRYVATHPDMGKRIARLKGLAAEGGMARGKYRDLPGKADWDRLKNACSAGQ